MVRFADHPAAAWILAVVALAVAAIGAEPYAGGWNDGCRLAAVESLIDRGTLAIDDSIFCKPPQHLIDAGMPPYPPDRPDLLTRGTLDKLLVRGHFHSDKPAVISILMAGSYRSLMVFGLPGPSERPDLFCWTMTVLSSGLGYAVAVGCLWALGRRVGLTPGWRVAWLGAFAFSTFAITYTRYVNNHAMHLGVLAGICLAFHRIAGVSRSDRPAWGSLFALGTLAGVGFNLDFGSGPPLVAFAFVAIWWRTRQVRPLLVFVGAVLPWVTAGIGLNYAIGGVWKPINMYPEHFRFPGSPFDETTLTGFLRHEPLAQLLYAGGMLFGNRGFWNHNLPLLLIVAVGWRVLLRHFTGRAELLALLGWCASAWGMYATLSNNMGGACCSIRWFLPCLAPAFWLLAIVLRELPRYRPDFVVLAGWGAVLGMVMWSRGPWILKMVPLMWPIVGCALLSWLAVATRRWLSGRTARLTTATAAELPRPVRHAA